MHAGLPPDTREHYMEFFATAEDLTGPVNWYRANFVDRMPVGEPPGNIDVPTLFIWSDADIALCEDGAVITGDYVDGPYQFEILEGVSHWIPEGAPDEVPPTAE